MSSDAKGCRDIEGKDRGRRVVLILLFAFLSAGCSSAPEPVEEPWAFGRTLRRWLEAVDGTDAQARVQACKAFAKLGPAAEPAVPRLIRMLKEDPPLRKKVLTALASIGPGARAAIPAIVKTRFRGDPDLRDARPWQKALAGIGRDSIPAIEILLKGSAQDRIFAVHVLAWMKGAVPEAVSVLSRIAGSEDEGLRVRAVEALGELGPGAIPALAALMRKGSPVRCEAALALGWIGWPTPEVRKLLTDALTEKELRLHAALGLARAARFDTRIARQIAPAILEGWRSSDPARSETVGAALLRMNPDSMLQDIIHFHFRGSWEESILFMLAPYLAKVTPGACEILAKLLLPNEDDWGSDALYALLAVGPVATPAVLQALREAKAGQSIRGATALLESWGARSRSAVPWLKETLENDTNAHGGEAAIALGKIGRAGVPILLNALSRENAELRRRAAKGLTECRSLPEEACPAIVRALGDEDEEVRRSAWTALGNLDPAPRDLLPILVKRLEDADGTVRIEAALRIARWFPDDLPARERAVPVLVEGLSSEEYCYDCLPFFYKNHHPSILSELWPALTGLLEHGSERVLYGACEICANLGPPAQSVLPALLEILKNGDREARQWAIMALGGIGPDAAAAIPLLLEILEDPSEEIRHYAASALGDIRLPDPKVLALLPRLSEDANPEIATGAIRRLGFADNPSREAIPAVIHALNRPEKQVRRSAVIALGRLTRDEDEAIEALIAALGDLEPVVRREAAESLGRIGLAAKAAVPHLRRALAFEEEGVSLAAAAALCKMEPDPRERARVLLLIRCFVIELPYCPEPTEEEEEDDADEDERMGKPPEDPLALGYSGQGKEAMEALVAMGKEAVPVLIESLVDPDDRFRVLAAEALGKIHLDPEESVPALRRALRDPEFEVRRASALALAEFGPAGKAAVPSLLEALRGFWAMARTEAAYALARIAAEDAQVRKAVLPALLDGLNEGWNDWKDDPRPTYFRCAEALGLLGEEAREALPILDDLCWADDKPLREAAVEAVRRITGKR